MSARFRPYTHAVRDRKGELTSRKAGQSEGRAGVGLGLVAPQEPSREEPAPPTEGDTIVSASTDVVPPLQVTFHQARRSDSHVSIIRRKAAHLRKHCRQVMGCHVWIKGPDRHHRKGRSYRVRLAVNLPGENVIVEHQPPDQDGHGWIGMRQAIDGAFRVAQQRLDERTDRRKRRRSRGRNVGLRQAVDLSLPAEK
jgi:hypothetical protein